MNPIGDAMVVWARLDMMPLGAWDGATRYDTDNEHVLKFWRGDEHCEIRWPKIAVNSRG